MIYCFCDFLVFIPSLSFNFSFFCLYCHFSVLMLIPSLVIFPRCDTLSWKESLTGQFWEVIGATNTPQNLQWMPYTYLLLDWEKLIFDSISNWPAMFSTCILTVWLFGGSPVFRVAPLFLILNRCWPQTGHSHLRAVVLGEFLLPSFAVSVS